MKKKTLRLGRETLAALQPDVLRAVAGGASIPFTASIKCPTLLCVSRPPLCKTVD